MIAIVKSIFTSKYGGYILLSILVLLGAFWFHQSEKSKAVEYARQELISQYEAVLNAERERSRRAENEIFQTTIERINQRDEQIKNLNIERDNLIASLRERERRSNNTGSSTDSKTCTGAELYREDAEFLARESARADRILEERNFWYSQYESVRKILEDLQNK